VKGRVVKVTRKDAINSMGIAAGVLATFETPTQESLRVRPNKFEAVVATTKNGTEFLPGDPPSIILYLTAYGVSGNVYDQILPGTPAFDALYAKFFN
jgi:hypothetical protein